jgi:hypothetical protein
MNKMGIESWEEMLKVAKGVLWSEAAGEITGAFHALGAYQQVFSAPSFFRMATRAQIRSIHAVLS